MKDAVIRAMTESDADAVSAIVAADYRFLAEHDDFTPEQLQRLLAERCTAAYLREGWLTRWDCYVAVCETRILGAVAIDGHEIAELWVAAACHRQGIGSRLFHYTEQRMREAGHLLLTLHCATHTAKPFYLAMGCELTGTHSCASGPLEGCLITRYYKKLE